MIINKNNATIINSKEVYIHDSTLTSAIYDFVDRKVRIELFDGTTIVFHNVVGVKSDSCAFWGKQLRQVVIDFEYVFDKDLKILPELYHIRDDIISQKGDISDTYLTADDSFFESSLILCSGERLNIACEWIEFDADETED